MKEISNSRFVFIDTETGGTIPEKHSLLSIGLVVWDLANGKIAESEYFIKSDNYVITKEARKINKFNESIHEKIAEEPDIVISKMLSFMNKYFPEGTFIPLAGHNVNFDINFLKVFFKNHNRSYNQYFSHRTIDTYSVYKTLVLSGLIAENLNSSHDAFSYFGIKVSKRHNALSDCLATVELYENLINLIKTGRC